MANKSIAFLAGVVFIVSFFLNELSLLENKCETTKQGTLTTCMNIPNLHDIPQDLPQKMEELILSDVLLLNRSIKADSFRRYPNLRRIDIRQISTPYSGMEFYEDAFSELINLRRLLLDNITYEESVPNADYKWPINLKRLELIHIRVLQLNNTESLAQLTYFKVASTNLTKFPRLNELAPLEAIILEENPIDVIRVKEIASFCLLQVFELSFTNEHMTNETHFLSPERKCECFRLKRWFATRKIPATLKCAVFSDGDEGIKLGNAKCPNASKFTGQETSLYEECLNHHSSSGILELLLYAVFFAVLFPLGYFASETYNRFKSSREEEKVKQKHRSGRLCKGNGSLYELDYEEECNESDQEQEEV